MNESRELKKKMKNNEKFLFQISEAARACGVSRSTLMRMEEKGLLAPAYIAPDSGRRYYDNHNVARVLQIEKLKVMGLGTEEIAGYFAHGGEVTLARLARKGGKYRMTIVPAQLIEFPPEEAQALGSLTTPEWPVAFARLRVSADEFLGRFPCNHIHGVYGDCVEELKTVARLLDMDVDVFDSTQN